MSAESGRLQRAEALELVMEQLGAALQQSACPVVPDESTRLMGSQAPLDSVGLMTLIIGLEREIEARYGRSLELGDDHAMSRRPSPFRSAGALADYICERVNEAAP